MDDAGTPPENLVPSSGGFGLGEYAVLFAAFAVISLGVYERALSGPFLADDYSMVVNNPYVSSPDSKLSEVLDPSGDARFAMVGNYAPVPVLAHALEWRLWQQDTYGYHVSNVVVHALNAVLLVALLCASAVPRQMALAAGALFALHPANVEAVAWISQLRTLLAMTGSLAALLLFRSWPLASLPLFVLALLSKASAAFALPVAAVLYVSWRRKGTLRARHGLTLALWGLFFAGFALVQLQLFASVSESLVDRYPDTATILRSLVAYGARYVAMAATGYGTSAYHDPDPTQSVVDPWFLIGLVIIGVTLWRIASSLRSGSEEAAWWLGAAAAYAPISPLFPFTFPMADRWLYFMLPGMLGGAILAGRAGWAYVEASRFEPASRRFLPVLRAAAIVLVGLLIVRFGLHATGRTVLWVEPGLLEMDSASQYPYGLAAQMTAAAHAVEREDRDQAVEHLIQASRRGAGIYMILNDPRFRSLASDPRFMVFAREGVKLSIERIRARGTRTQTDLKNLALNHNVLGEFDEAIDLAEQALRMGGPHQAELSDILWQWRALRAAREREAND